MNQGLESKSMPEMPHAAFSPECRGQENAEPQFEDYRKILEDRRLTMSSGSCDSALFFDVRQLPL
jgi:hypothetical protein